MSPDEPPQGSFIIDEKGRILAMNPVAQVFSGPAQAGEAAGEVSAESVAALSREALRARERELDLLKQDFVARMTHELRAPLTSIKAALEILLEEKAPPLSERGLKLAGTALSNADRLAALIGMILDFFKIESGQMTVRPKKESPAALVREAAESLRPWAEKKRIELAIQAEASLPSVRADKLRAVQVLVNLVSNAIKFTPVGGRIELRAAHDPKLPEKLVVFSVADSGPGIPQSKQRLLFKKFSQVLSEPSAGGTGLGLSIARAFVRLQGGHIWVESTEGRGATFSFTLPAWSGEAEDAAARKPFWKKLWPFWKRPGKRVDNSLTEP